MPNLLFLCIDIPFRSRDCFIGFDHKCRAWSTSRRWRVTSMTAGRHAMKIVGVDVGGTFTDIISLDAEARSFAVAKVPSTPQDQSLGFVNGLSKLEDSITHIQALVHGTTVATNAILE